MSRSRDAAMRLLRGARRPSYETEDETVLGSGGGAAVVVVAVVVVVVVLE